MRELKWPLLMTAVISLLAAGGCANRPPTLNCLVEQPTVTEGESVTIRTNAADPDRDPLTFDWSATSGRVTGQNGSGVFDSTGLSPGKYTITANVRDRDHTVSCAVAVNVDKNMQTPTVACEPSNVSVTEGQSTTLRVKASDPNNDDLTYSWQVDGQMMTNDRPSFEFGTAGRSVGSHTVRVTVSDVDNMSADCAFNVTIDRRPNRNPTVTLRLDRNQAVAGETITATAQANDPDGDPLTYSWSVDGQRRSETSSTLRLNTSGLAGGARSISVTVRDDRGGSATDTQSLAIQERITIQIDRIQPNNVAKAALDEIALKMQQNPQLRATITGHTDDRGSEQVNQRVGQRRADAARDYLVQEHNIAENRIETRSAGESEPMTSNDTSEGRQENRRVVVELHTR